MAAVSRSSSSDSRASALRNRVAGDWSPDLKPLSILCNETEYLPRYVVDSIQIGDFLPIFII